MAVTVLKGQQLPFIRLFLVLKCKVTFHLKIVSTAIVLKALPFHILCLVIAMPPIRASHSAYLVTWQREKHSMETTLLRTLQVTVTARAATAPAMDSLGTNESATFMTLTP